MFFLFLHKNLCVWYLLEVPYEGATFWLCHAKACLQVLLMITHNVWFHTENNTIWPTRVDASLNPNTINAYRKIRKVTHFWMKLTLFWLWKLSLAFLIQNWQTSIGSVMFIFFLQIWWRMTLSNISCLRKHHFQITTLSMLYQGKIFWLV